MNAPSVALLALALLAPAALGLDIVELKDGRVLEVEKVEVKRGKLFVRLHVRKPGQVVAYAIPFDRVVPEFVYYAWAAGIDAGDAAGWRRLADWARGHGLFRLAWRSYGNAAATDQTPPKEMAELKAKLREEEATWSFEEAWRLFRAGDAAAARVRVERLLEGFPDSKEAGRAQGLLSIIREREQFMSEQKKQAEIAKRARKQRREVDRLAKRMRQADSQVLRARFIHAAEAKRRLAWAAYTYRKAALRLADLLDVVEVDDLRLTLEALLGGVQERLVRTFLKLGDLRYLTGDVAGALDAAHEVLSIDPRNKDAAGLRSRVLDRAGREDRPLYGTYSPYGGLIYLRRIRARYLGLNGLGVYVPERIGIRYRSYRYR